MVVSSLRMETNKSRERERVEERIKFPKFCECFARGKIIPKKEICHLVSGIKSRCNISKTFKGQSSLSSTSKCPQNRCPVFCLPNTRQFLPAFPFSSTVAQLVSIGKNGALSLMSLTFIRRVAYACPLPSVTPTFNTHFDLPNGASLFKALKKEWLFFYYSIFLFFKIDRHRERQTIKDGNWGNICNHQF